MREPAGGESSVLFSPYQADAISIETIPTDLGWIALAHHGETLQGLVMGHASADRASAALKRLIGRQSSFQTTACDSALAEDLRRFAEGEPVDLANVEIDQRHLAPFARRVVAACRRIAWGQTRTYGQLAAECGSPAAARAVGQVMARNRFPLVVPCHRVLAAGGRLGGFSAPQGLRLKRRLLALKAANACSVIANKSPLA